MHISIMSWRSRSLSVVGCCSSCSGFGADDVAMCVASVRLFFSSAFFPVIYRSRNHYFKQVIDALLG